MNFGNMTSVEKINLFLHSKQFFNKMQTLHFICRNQGRDSPTLKLSYLSLWVALFQGKTLLEEKTVIVELGESWPT